MRLGKPIAIRAVSDADATAIPYDEANAEFHKAWRAARDAYAELLDGLSGAANPLFHQTGPVPFQRITTAQYSASRIREAAVNLAASLDTCADLWNRTDRTTVPR